MPFPKIMKHPHKDMIVRLLTEGKGVREVAKILKQSFPDTPELHISANTLQKFRQEHLQLDKDALEQIKREQRAKTREKEKKKEHTQVRNMPSYRKKIQEAVDVHIDIRTSLGELDGLLRERIEDFFNKAQSGTASVMEEKILQGYFDRYFVLLDKWAKYVDKLADMRVETNVNVTLIQDQMAALRRVVLKLLNKMDPDKAVIFLEELNIEMAQLEEDKPPRQSFQEIKGELDALPAAEIEEIRDGD